MKALVCFGKNDYRLETDYPIPKVGSGDILIKVEGCGVCAGDVKAYRGAEMYWGNELMKPHVQVPAIPGHEFIGEIVEIGADVTDFGLGDRVLAEQLVPCGKCRFCRDNQYWMCQEQAVFGFRYYVNGGMAEYMLLPKGSIVHRLPKETPLEKIILTEPFTCSKHAVDRAKITEDDVVVISGAGTLGLGMVAIAKRQNPRCLIVVDLVDARLQIAKRMGADIVVNPQKESLLDIVNGQTDGYGCDVYIEAAGHPASVTQGLHVIRKLGRFVEFGVFAAPTSVDWTIIGNRKELDLLGSHLGPNCFPDIIEWISNDEIPTEGLVTHKYSLDDWEKAFEAAEKVEESVKTIIIP